MAQLWKAAGRLIDDLSENPSTINRNTIVSSDSLQSVETIDELDEYDSDDSLSLT